EKIEAREKAALKPPPLRLQLAPGLDWKQVDRAIARGGRMGDLGHRAVAFYLAECADRGLYQEAGFSNVITYAMRRHHMSRRLARELIAVGRALRALIKIDDAFKHARLPWSKIRAIAVVAELATEEDWLTYALTHTIEQIVALCARSKKGDKPRE